MQTRWRRRFDEKRWQPREIRADYRPPPRVGYKRRGGRSTPKGASGEQRRHPPEGGIDDQTQAVSRGRGRRPGDTLVDPRRRRAERRAYFQAAPLPGPEIALADADAGALGEARRRCGRRQGEDRDLSLDVSRRCPAPAVPPGRRRRRRHRLDRERLYARPLPAFGSVRAADHLHQRHRRDQSRDEEALRRVPRAGIRGGESPVPPRPWRTGDPDGEGSGPACRRPEGQEAQGARPDGQRRRRGAGRHSGHHAGARPAAGA